MARAGEVGQHPARLTPPDLVLMTALRDCHPGSREAAIRDPCIAVLRTLARTGIYGSRLSRLARSAGMTAGGGHAMSFIVDKIKWIMLVSGALTCTMIYAAIAPQAALQGTFGETLAGPLAEIVVRNWGVLITVDRRDADLRRLPSGEPPARAHGRGGNQACLHRSRARAGQPLPEPAGRHSHCDRCGVGRAVRLLSRGATRKK